MDVIQQFISEDLIYALGWTVMHSLWQGFLIAVLMAITLQVFRKKSSRLRYEVATFSLFLVFISAVCTFIWYLDTAATASDHHLVNMVVPELHAATAADTGLLQGVTQSCIDYFNEHLPLIVLLWLVGVAFFVLRLLGGLVYVQRLKHHRVAPLSPYWQKKVQNIAAKIPTKKMVGILESASVKVPMVIGYFKPIILMPIGAVNQLDEKEIEAVIAHELAHVFRNDFLLNIIMSFIEVFFYYHPAVWWISGNIRLERENCCDDIAIRVSGNSLDYAKALVRLQELKAYTPGFAMPFSGQRNQLLNRIKRILNQPQNRSNIIERLTATCFLLIAVLFMSVSAGKSQQDLAQQPDFETEIELENAYLEHEVEKEFFEVMVVMDSVPEERKVLEGNVLKLKQKKGNVIEAELDGKRIPKEELDAYNSFELEGKVIVEQVEEEEIHWPRIENIGSQHPLVIGRSNARFPGFLSKQSSVTRSTDEDGKMVIVVEGVGNSEPVEIIVDDANDLFLVEGEVLENGDTALLADNYIYHFKEPFRVFNEARIQADSVTFDFHEKFRDNQIDWFEKAREDRLQELRTYRKPGFYFSDSDTMPEELAKIYKRYYNEALIDRITEMHQERSQLTELQKKELALLKRELAERQVAFERNQNKLRAETKALREDRQIRRNKELLAKRYKLYQTGKEEELKRRYEVLRSDRLTQRIISELKKDGLIEDSDNFSFSLSESKLKVNKEKQSKALLEKYLKLYKELSGNELKGKSKFQMSTSSPN